MADNNEDNVKPEGQSGALWTLRRAELDWWRLVQKATFDHQERSAAALTEYHKAMGQILEGAANEEKAALETASELEKADTPPERRLAIMSDWNERVAGIRRNAQARIREASTKLAEAQQQSWLDTSRKQNEAYIAYVSATQDIYSAAPPMPPGDEGRGAGFGWNWMDPYMGQTYPGYGGRC